MYSDIDRIGEVAELLGVSCDYLLKDNVREENETPLPATPVSRLLKGALNKKCRLTFFEDEGDPDLWDSDCTILDFEGGRMKVEAETKKGTIEKLIPVASVLSVEFK